MYKVLEVKSTEELTKLLEGDEFSFRFEYGYGKPLRRMQLADAHELVKAIIMAPCRVPCRVLYPSCRVITVTEGLS